MSGLIDHDTQEISCFITRKIKHVRILVHTHVRVLFVLIVDETPPTSPILVGTSVEGMEGVQDGEMERERVRE